MRSMCQKRQDSKAGRVSNVPGPAMIGQQTGGIRNVRDTMR